MLNLFMVPAIARPVRAASVARLVSLGPPFAISLVFGLLAIAAIVVSRSIAVHFDEGYNLNLIGTLAETGRYATRFGDVTRRFDPAITTGPTALLPLAPVLVVFGPSLDAVRSYQVASFLLYTLVIAGSVRVLVGWPAALAIVPVLVTIPVVSEVSLSVLGEYPAAALLIAGTALLALAERTTGRMALLLLLASGLALGLAVLAKDIAWLYVLSIGVVVAYQSIRQRRVGYLIPPAIAFGATLAWRVYQYLSLRLDDPRVLAAWQRDLAERSPAFFSDIAWNPLSNASDAWRNGLELFWPYLVGFAVALVGSALLWLVPRRPSRTTRPVGIASLSLVLGSIVWIGWFLFLSGAQAGDRHFVIGVVISQIFLIVVAARLVGVSENASNDGHRAHPTSWRGAAAACALLWAVICLAHGSRWNVRFIDTSSAKLASQLAVADRAREYVPPDEAVSGWSWHIPWEIAFLTGRHATTADRGSPTLRGLSDWLVVSPSLAATRPRDRRLDELLSRQGEPVVSSGGYELYRIRWRPGRS